MAKRELIDLEEGKEIRMADDTEGIRRVLVAQINSDVRSPDTEEERRRLEAIYGKVWDMDEVSVDFRIIGFMAPFVVAKKKATGEEGILMFQHSPRFYFGWRGPE